jgi:hypothetical protein
VKIFEILTQSKGTYAGVRYDADSVNRLKNFIVQHKIPNPIKPQNFHTTLLYSRKYLPNYKPCGKLQTPFSVIPSEFVIWKTNASGGAENNSPQTNCLVLKCQSSDLVNRHNELMNIHQAIYDYPEYVPHITLSYDVGDFDISTLSAPHTIGTLYADEEYGEELNLNWAKTKGTKQ